MLAALEGGCLGTAAVSLYDDDDDNDGVVVSLILLLPLTSLRTLPLYLSASASVPRCTSIRGT